MATDQDIGIDVSCGEDLDPLCRDITGVPLMIQDMYWRAVTPPGELIEDEAYGYGLIEQLGESHVQSDADSSMATIAAQLQIEFLKDERVFRVLVTPRREKTAEGDDLYLFDVKGVGADGPFAFGLSTVGVTVALLTVDNGTVA